MAAGGRISAQADTLRSMTADVIALCRREPDADAILAALGAAGPGLRVRPIEHAGLIQLCGGDGRALVTIEGPLLVRVAGEADRILGPGSGAPHPAWWVEARAPSGGPAASPGGREIARGFAEALVAATGGCTWPSP